LPGHAKDFALTRARRQQSFGDFNGGRFAGAVGSEQTKPFAGLDGKIESSNGLDFSVVGLLQPPAEDGSFHTKE